MTTVHLDDPNVIEALKSVDGKTHVTRDSLKNGLTAAEAQLVWDFAMQQHARCESAKGTMERFMRDMETMLEDRRNEFLGTNGHAANGHAANGALPPV